MLALCALGPSTGLMPEGRTTRNACLVAGVHGAFYGTTELGGIKGGGCSYGCGTVFTLSP
jgi:hypothetical protein